MKIVPISLCSCSSAAFVGESPIVCGAERACGPGSPKESAATAGSCSQLGVHSGAVNTGRAQGDWNKLQGTAPPVSCCVTEESERTWLIHQGFGIQVVILRLYLELA